MTGAEPRRAPQRAARTAAAARVLRGDITGWLGERGSDHRFARFAGHFAVLEAVLLRMLDAIDRAVAGIPEALATGAVYQRCRALDRSLVTVARLFEWYAQKYDQRLDDRCGPALHAADEMVRSCWSEPFAALGRRPPTGPLPYLDARYDALATPRVSVPPDLRAPADALVAEYVRELPIPTIALPDAAWREAWWLVLAAHETGHHVQKDLAPGVEDATRAALSAAVASSAADADLAADWWGWAAEAFADAYSVLMVGGGAAWAIEELQIAAPAELVTVPDLGGRYPPPAVRLALLGELQRCAGAGAGRVSAAEVRGWLDALALDAVAPAARTAVRRHLTVVPRVAAALVDLPIGETTLRVLSGVRPEWFAPAGQLALWARQLRTDRPFLSPLQTRTAARLAVAAGVAAYEQITGRTAEAGHTRLGGAGSDAEIRRLNRNLLGTLPECGVGGVLAAEPAPADVTALADRLAARLVA
jgi:hypothetical protein